MLLPGISTNHDECLPAVYSPSAALTQTVGKRRHGFPAKRNNLPGQRGSASVEFATVLPLVAIAMLAVVQISLLAWDQMRVAHAAREGARMLALANDVAAVKEAALQAGALDGERTTIEVAPDSRPAGTPSRVTIRYRPRIVVPLIGRYVPEVTITATVWMRVERDGP